MLDDPRTVDAKDLDPRISYDKQDDKWIFEDPETDDRLEFNIVLSQWVKSENLQLELQELKKRKLQQMKEDKLKQKRKPRVNSGVYASNLPLDIDSVEIKQVFGKYGVIAQDLLTNKPRIKMYLDEEDNFKGDALIVYLKPESVDLAVQMLDDTQLRVNGAKIKVERAQFKPKDDGDEAPKKQLTEEERKVIKKRYKILSSKTEDWQGDDETVNPKWVRTMVLKRAFTLEEIQRDPLSKEDIVEDFQEESEQFGAVDKVILFDQEEEGVVLVRFQTGDATLKAIEVSSISCSSPVLTGRHSTVDSSVGRSSQRPSTTVSTTTNPRRNIRRRREMTVMTSTITKDCKDTSKR